MLLEVINFCGGRSMHSLVQQAAARRPLTDVGRVVDRLVRAAAASGPVSGALCGFVAGSLAAQSAMVME